MPRRSLLSSLEAVRSSLPSSSPSSSSSSLSLIGSSRKTNKSVPFGFHRSSVQVQPSLDQESSRSGRERVVGNDGERFLDLQQEIRSERTWQRTGNDNGSSNEDENSRWAMARATRSKLRETQGQGQGNEGYTYSENGRRWGLAVPVPVPVPLSREGDHSHSSVKENNQDKEWKSLTAILGGLSQSRLDSGLPGPQSRQELGSEATSSQTASPFKASFAMSQPTNNPYTDTHTPALVSSASSFSSSNTSSTNKNDIQTQPVEEERSIKPLDETHTQFLNNLFPETIASPELVSSWVPITELLSIEEVTESGMDFTSLSTEDTIQDKSSTTTTSTTTTTTTTTRATTATTTLTSKPTYVLPPDLKSLLKRRQYRKFTFDILKTRALREDEVFMDVARRELIWEGVKYGGRVVEGLGGGKQGGITSGKGKGQGKGKQRLNGQDYNVSEDGFEDEVESEYGRSSGPGYGLNPQRQQRSASGEGPLRCAEALGWVRQKGWFGSSGGLDFEHRPKRRELYEKYTLVGKMVSRDLVLDADREDWEGIRRMKVEGKVVKEKEGFGPVKSPPLRLRKGLLNIREEREVIEGNFRLATRPQTESQAKKAHSDYWNNYLSELFHPTPPQILQNPNYPSHKMDVTPSSNLKQLNQLLRVITNLKLTRGFHPNIVTYSIVLRCWLRCLTARSRSEHHWTFWDTGQDVEILWERTRDVMEGKVKSWLPVKYLLKELKQKDPDYWVETRGTKNLDISTLEKGEHIAATPSELPRAERIGYERNIRPIGKMFAKAFRNKGEYEKANEVIGWMYAMKEVLRDDYGHEEQ